MKSVKRVEYNWFFTTGNGEEYGYFEVGKHGVERIDYHAPDGHGDQHYCDVYSLGAWKERIFNINRIVEFDVREEDEC